MASKTELERVKEALHYCNGVSELAMKHRDEAEAELARIRSCLIGWREYDWPEGFDRRTAELLVKHVFPEGDAGR